MKNLCTVDETGFRLITHLQPDRSGDAFVKCHVDGRESIDGHICFRKTEGGPKRMRFISSRSNAGMELSSRTAIVQSAVGYGWMG